MRNTKPSRILVVTGKTRGKSCAMEASTQSQKTSTLRCWTSATAETGTAYPSSGRMPSACIQSDPDSHAAVSEGVVAKKGGASYLR